MKKLLLFAVSVLMLSCNSKDWQVGYVASPTATAYLYEYTKEKTFIISDSIVRGSEIKFIKNNQKGYYQVRAGKVTDGFLPITSIVLQRKDAVSADSIFVRTPASIIDDTVTSHICGLAQKGQCFKVLEYDTLYNNGEIERLKVSSGNTCGWIYSKYTVCTSEQALQRYDTARYDTIHLKVRNPYNAGKAIDCDYFPVQKPAFENNIMPSPVYSLYLTISPINLERIDEYIALAKQTRINTFVLDIKDNECPGYKAETMAEFSPTNYKWGGKSKERLMHKAIERLHEEGFYVVGRITCFKDSYFVQDNPQCAITDRQTGQPFYHNHAYWPSAYDRRVWQFNVELAKESVRKLGFNEINFDYVRFPDKMQSVENQIDYHDRYNESKIQAIQRFIQYATDELHRLGVYVSIDVFGETANKGYTTAYGQYWPAMSNVADVICGMPYPDHFAPGFAKISKPWNNPYQTLNAWGRYAMSRQAETPTPARVRTWVQCYHVLRYVDPNGIDYDAANIEKEIRGLFDAGARDGYITWLSNGSLDKYTEKADAFKIDYTRDWQ